MKPIIHFICFLFSVNTYFSQAIKIYVTDTETNKNISKAKVRLEGFNIPPIKAQYNKKNNYYYFTEIPKNYNTIMVYHKKYNEKGFQNVEGLPKELSLKLHKPLYNYYSFIDEKERYKGRFPHVFFVEDPYKIVIRSSSNMPYKEFKDKLFNYIKEKNIDIEPINPFTEYHARNSIDKLNYDNSDPYPDLKNDSFCAYPNIDGYDDYDRECIKRSLRGQNNYKVENVFFFRKKDKSKFKRYNDETIEKIEKSQEFHIYPVLYYKGSTYDNLESKKIDPSNLYIKRDKANNKFNRRNKIDSSSIYFYSNEYALFKINKNGIYRGIQEPDLNYGCVEHFKLIEKNNCNPFYIMDGLDESFCLFRDEETDENKQSSFNLKKYPGLGLGILDIFEHYNSIVKK